MTAEEAPNRTVLRLSGGDRAHFLHGLVTNDARPGQLVYSALLSPQGKFLADFFLLDRGEDILLDVSGDLAPDLYRRLAMYKLRADVTIEDSGLPEAAGHGQAAVLDRDIGAQLVHGKPAIEVGRKVARHVEQDIL
ncbi:MAG: hypothetical protein R6U99_14365, partial [Nioella sp.]